MTNGQLKDAAATLLLLVCLPARAAGSASAPWDLRVGGAVGFGAGGTVQDVVRIGAIEPISRSEGPGSFSLSNLLEDLRGTRWLTARSTRKHPV